MWICVLKKYTPHQLDRLMLQYSLTDLLCIRHHDPHHPFIMVGEQLRVEQHCNSMLHLQNRWQVLVYSNISHVKREILR
jgi:hypothetical protein